MSKYIFKGSMLMGLHRWNNVEDVTGIKENKPQKNTSINESIELEITVVVDLSNFKIDNKNAAQVNFLSDLENRIKQVLSYRENTKMIVSDLEINMKL